MVRRPKRRSKAYVGYIYILPATIFIVLFAFMPIGMAVYYSMTKFNVIQAPQWLGFQNYISLFKDPYFSAALRNTLLYASMDVPTTTIISMLLAALLTSRERNAWTGFVKSALFIPVISSMILVGTLWRIMYNPQMGLINQFLNIFGIDSINWLGSSALALPSVCIVGIWKNVGYFMVIYIAAIMDIPRDLYEAARVDGATGTQQFWHITLPMLRPITFLVVTLGTIWSFQVFDLVYMMTGGGPGKATVTLVSIIYNSAFRDYKMGYACAMAMFLFGIIVAISGLQQLLMRDRSNRKGGAGK
jgi:multiple sugar transport system permease protein